MKWTSFICWMSLFMRNPLWESSSRILLERPVIRCSIRISIIVRLDSLNSRLTRVSRRLRQDAIEFRLKSVLKTPITRSQFSKLNLHHWSTIWMLQTRSSSLGQSTESFFWKWIRNTHLMQFGKCYSVNSIHGNHNVPRTLRHSNVRKMIKGLT